MSTDFNYSLNNLFKIFSEITPINFWKNRLTTYKQMEGLLYKNSQNEETLFGFIQKKIDLSNLYDYYINQTEKNFWNESIQELIEKEEGLFKGEVFNNIFEIEDIRNADAGLSFETLNNFVKPWKNLNNENYLTCRSDEVSTVILNETELQFTESQSVLSTIRLIMPQNTRRVEIEDLNRNFWVIGDVTSGICKFLFDNNGLKGVLEDIIAELGGLWENLLYLWCAAGLLASEKSRTIGVHCEVLYLPNNSFQPYKKYDDFDNNWAFDEEYPIFIDNPNKNLTNFQRIKNRIAFLKEKYPKHDLCILPCIRYQNYEHNYYYYECYPYLYFYDRANDKETYKFLYSYYASRNPKNNKILSYFQPLTFGVDLGLPSDEATARVRCAAGITFGSYLYGINQEHTIYYYPYSSIQIKYDSEGEPTSSGMLVEDTDNNYRYDAQLEIKPILSCQRVDNQLQAELSFDFLDVGERLIFNTYSVIGNVSTQNTITNIEGDVEFGTSSIDGKQATDFITYPVKDNYYKGELITNYDYSSYLKGAEVSYDTKGLKIANQGVLLKIGGYFPKTEYINNLIGISVKMQAPITDEWKDNLVREVLDSSGKRTGYQCNLTIGNKGTDWNSIAQYFNGHTIGNALNPVADQRNSVFMAEKLSKTNGNWYLSFSKICQDAYYVQFDGSNDDQNACGIKGLSAEMGQQYFQYAFEQDLSSRDFLDYHKINYIITSIGVSSWLGGAAYSTTNKQGYQGYWEQNILCYYVRYIPIEYLDNYIPTIPYSSFTRTYPINVNNKVVGYLDYVVPVNRAEGFVGDFLYNILKPSSSGDRWRLPQLNASNKTPNTIYRIHPITSAKFLYHYNKVTRRIEQIELDKESYGNEWYVTSDELNLPDNPTPQQVEAAISEYEDSGGEHYTARDILNKEYKISGIWNLFDGYTSSITGNKETFVGGKHTQVLQLFFTYSNTDEEFKLFTEQGQSQYRAYNEVNWHDYESADGSLGKALPYQGYVFSQTHLTYLKN